MNRRRSIRMRVRALVFSVLALVGVVGSVVVPATVGTSPAAHAVAWPEYEINMGRFFAGEIVGDALFFDPKNMTQTGVQTFLNEKVPVCDPGYTCLKDKTDATYSIPANPMCLAYSGGGTETSAAIIYKVAQACGISPKVILVTLQKEQGLVTDTWPSDRQYRYAMGADCPDSGDGCGLTAGFFQQVYRGTYMLKRYTQPPGTGPGTNYETDFAAMKPVNQSSDIRYSPRIECGSTRIHIENMATHVLYVYTPYTPNEGARNAGWGTADCGAYGNRNFFRYWFQWFGDPNGNPPQVSSYPDSSGDVVGQENIGNVLSVTPGTWTGAPTPTISYQWYRCVTQTASMLQDVPANCRLITNATRAKYRLSAADAGFFVAPVVTATNQAGSSLQMPPTTAKVYQPPVNTVRPVLSGVGQPNETLAVTPGTWTGNPTLTYRWWSCPTALKSPTCAQIANASSASLRVRMQDVGTFLLPEVIGTNRDVVSAFPVGGTEITSAPIVTTPDSISRTALVGSEVKVIPGTWVAAPAATNTYQFFACPTQVATTSQLVPDTCASVSAASTRTSFAVPPTIKGKYVVAKVTASNTRGSTVSVTKSTLAVADDQKVPVITGEPLLTMPLSASGGVWPGLLAPVVLTMSGPQYDGYPIFGVQEALRADGFGTPRTGVYDARTVADVRVFQQRHGVPVADGYVGPRTWGEMTSLQKVTPARLSYQWMRCVGPVVVTPTEVPSAAPASCVAIGGATDASYTPVAGDRSKYLLVAVTATNTSAVVKTRWSLTTTQVPVAPPTAPVATVTDTVSTTAPIGGVVTVSGGTWTANPDPTITYEFFSCPTAQASSASEVPADCVSVQAPSDATQFIVPASLAGTFILAKVTASNLVGSTVSVTRSTSAVAASPRNPTISADPVIGTALSASGGVWPGLLAPVVLTMSGPQYDGYPIFGVQEALRADGFGTPRTGVYDARTVADVRVFQQRHGVPVADGYVGPRTWGEMTSLQKVTPARLSYQWMRCAGPVVVTPTEVPSAAPASCVAIGGATDASYTPVAGDRSKYLLVAVTATNTSAAVKTRWSLTTTQVP